MSEITAVVTTSPIPLHSSTAYIDAVYGSIRHHLPDCKILILADGVRSEQQHLANEYAEYKRRLQDKNWTNIEVKEFSEFTHQAGMIRIAMSEGWIQTPLLFWVEHDFPMNYTPIDWNGIIQTLISGEVHCIRFCYDDDTRYFDRPNQKEQFRNLTGRDMILFTSRAGVPLLPVVWMDTLPHVARVDFYQYLLQVFKTGRIHVDCAESNQLIEQSYPQWKVALYAPRERTIKKFEGLKGRGSEPKYPMTL